MFDVSPEGANLWFDLSNVVLLVGAVLVALGTYGTIKFAAIKERYSDERIAANEAEAKRAIADSDIAKAEAAKANESAAKLNNETARLQADNLALQTVLLPRHVGAIGVNEAARAQTWFAGADRFAGTALVIQCVNDAEAQALADEIALVVTRLGGWKVSFVTEKISHIAEDRIFEGVTVFYPTGKPWTPQEPRQPWLAWHDAAEFLAVALTKAGLGIGSYRVPREGFSNTPPDPRFGSALPFSPYFDPPIEGVYLQVGARPVAAAVGWIKQGRPDELGNPPQDAGPQGLNKRRLKPVAPKWSCSIRSLTASSSRDPGAKGAEADPGCVRNFPADLTVTRVAEPGVIAMFDRNP